MAGSLGFEPRYAEIKTPCLTAWRRPNNHDINYLPVALKTTVTGLCLLPDKPAT
jgi:hypothetical protein